MKLFYRKFGNGPPLIILHGLYGSSDNWVSLGQRLGGFYTVILPDMRNHGQSPHSEIHDYESMARDIKELAGELKLDKIFLAGHSMGGKCAMVFSALYGEMLSGLLIADISPVADEKRIEEATTEHLGILSAMQSIDLKRYKRREEIDDVLSVSIGHSATREFILKNLRRKPEGSFIWKINIKSLLANIHEITGTPEVLQVLKEQLTGFPVVFLRGEKSGYIRESDFSEITRIYPAADIITVPGAGHWLHADNPDFVVNAFKNLVGQ